MTTYCKCSQCSANPAVPNGDDNGRPEIVSGKLIQLSPGDTLVHYSNGDFSTLYSRELANITLRGVNPTVVCISFWLYRGSEGPDKPTKAMKLLGLGSKYKYTLGSDCAGKLSIYQKYKDASPGANEVVLAVGCGGSVDIGAGRRATRVNSFDSMMAPAV
ncbi:hypothetical protein SLH49_06540 [Cognatiyoonia sp. IB215446]|uniref:hypothetical protein n=1 Tax=Cognatiyoonia sp. IB215446 TaxID=3097355 RepID=UPI002A12DA24|nr:hypothetical protein [Cognatiyoonia sp. IB215446]MDX8347640.1 hypothetical protein [Cognatiyoonia sp. IB215446]